MLVCTNAHPDPSRPTACAIFVAFISTDLEDVLAAHHIFSELKEQTYKLIHFFSTLTMHRVPC